MLENDRKPEFYEPAPGMLVIEPIEFGKTEAGLIIPGATKLGPPIAKIVGVGPSRLSVDGMTEEVPCNVGDYVLLSPSMVLCMSLDDHGRKRGIMDFSAVLAIVVRPKNISIKMAVSPPKEEG